MPHQGLRQDIETSHVPAGRDARRGEPATLARGLEHHRAGDLRRAGAAYRRVLRKDPHNGEALHLLGLLHQDLGRPERARQLVAKAIETAPKIAIYHHNLGSILRSLGHTEAAVTSFRAALDLAPKAAETWTALGSALTGLGRFDEAAACHERALELRPGFAEALSNLGSTLKQAGHLNDAVDKLRGAVALAPDHAEIRFNLGNALLAAARFEAAEDAFQHALSLRPNHAFALSNLGVALREQGRPAEAAASLRAAIALNPGFAEAHWNLGLTLLMQGEGAAGWQEYEWRRRMADFPMRRFDVPPFDAPPFDVLPWDGGPLAGRTLLIHAEQALGDAIQFVRYASLLQAQANGAANGVANNEAGGAAGHVVLECPAAIVPLFSGAAGGLTVVARGDRLPSFDVHVPLMSLPGLCDPDLARAGGMVPYLSAAPVLEAAWRARLGADGRLAVGICWQGNPDYRADARRSIAVERFVPLARRDGLRLISLQKGFGEDQLAKLADGTGIESLGPDFDAGAGAFMDTAAVMKNLDLVICSDTAVAHLAGALGVEVWLLLAAVPDWRWGTEGRTSPWYPNMRLFRQTDPGDWDGVFRHVDRELGRRLSRPRTGGA